MTHALLSPTRLLPGAFAALSFSIALLGAGGCDRTSGTAAPGPVASRDPTSPGDGTSPTARNAGVGTSSDDAPGDAPAPRADGGLDPAGPSVQFIGRFDTRDPRGPQCGFPGCRIVARFDGTAVSVKLEGQYYDWMEGAPSDWDVAIDGVITKKITVTLGEQSFDLASDLPSGPHVVELYKRSETQTGLGRFLGFDFHGGKLLAPELRSARHLEMIGDSQPAAFGVEANGQGPNCPGIQWAGSYQNFRKSFAARLGERFGAEVFGTVYSGKGIAQDIWSTDDETMPIIYKRANALDPSSTWDFAAWTPDVILIMMGGNDFAIGQPFDRGPTTLAAFTAASRSFAADLRSHYPKAWIFFLLSPSVTDEEPPGRQSRTNVAAGMQAVVNERNAAGDKRVVYFAPRLATPDELVGCNGHGTPAYHQRVADEIAPLVTQKLGW